MKNAPYIFVAMLLAAMLGGVFMHAKDGEREAQDRILLLSHHVVTHDSIFAHDTIVFTRTLKVPIALHDTVVKHLSDTVLVARYIAASDSALHACSAVFQSCKASLAVRDSIIAAYKSLKPSRLSVGLIGGCGVGVARPWDCIIGVGGSIRIF